MCWTKMRKLNTISKTAAMNIPPARVRRRFDRRWMTFQISGSVGVARTRASTMARPPCVQHEVKNDILPDLGMTPVMPGQSPCSRVREHPEVHAKPGVAWNGPSCVALPNIVGVDWRVGQRIVDRRCDMAQCSDPDDPQAWPEPLCCHLPGHHSV